MDQEGIIRFSGLSRRTVKYALQRLKGENLVSESFEFSDLRRKLYAAGGI